VSLRVIFQMDPLSCLNLQRDSTLALIEEAQNRNHEIYHYIPSALTWKNKHLWAWGSKFNPRKNKEDAFSLGTLEHLELDTFHILFIRQDPPFNMGYITLTYLLEHLTEKVLLVNNPQGILQSPEKLLTTHFPDLIPPTLITQNLSQTHHFLEEYQHIVIKPLYEFGGEGVLHFKKEDMNLAATLELFQKAYPEQPWIVQQFLPEILTEGDRRLFLVDGQLIGGYKRLPSRNSIRSNAAQGGSAAAYTPTSRDQEICEAIGPTLVKRGLFFVGIDIIGSYLIEINVTCPTGLRIMDQLYHMNSASLIWDILEEKVRVF
jgi:glutathione synthase